MQSLLVPTASSTRDAQSKDPNNHGDSNGNGDETASTPFVGKRVAMPTAIHTMIMTRSISR